MDQSRDMIEHIVTRINYWDRVAHEKCFSHPLRMGWLARYLSKQAWLLDYGCGYGRTLAQLTRTRFTNIIGMDFSEVMLRRCRSEIPGAKLIRNDGRGLPLQSGSVAVLLFAVLTCIPENDEQRVLLAEVERVLRPGGLIYISDLLLNEDARNRERYDLFAEAYKCYGVFELPEGVTVRHHRKEWIEELTSSLEKLESEPFQVTTMNENTSAAFQYLGRKSIERS